MVFNQEHRTDNPHVLDFTGDLSDPLVKKMVERLARAVSDPDVRRAMDAEAEVDRTIRRILDEEKLQHQTELQTVIQEKEAALATIQEKDRLIAELQQQLAAKDEGKEQP